MAAEFPTAIPTFTGSTETAPATTTPSGFAAWATKAKDEIVAMAQKAGVGPGKGLSTSFASGLWNSQEGPTGNTNGTQDTLYLRRYEFPHGTTLTQLGLWVFATGATATSVFRFGIYNDDGTGTYPGTLLLDAGVTTADLSTTGFKSCTAFSATDVSGIKWLGGAVQVASPGTNTLVGLSAQTPGMAIATVPNGNVMLAYTQSAANGGAVTGALPSPFSNGTRAVANAAAKIFYK